MTSAFLKTAFCPAKILPKCVCSGAAPTFLKFLSELKSALRKGAIHFTCNPIEHLKEIKITVKLFQLVVEKLQTYKDELSYKHHAKTMSGFDKLFLVSEWLEKNLELLNVVQIDELLTAILPLYKAIKDYSTFFAEEFNRICN